MACVPSQCNGPKCCCCSSTDIVLEVRARCYDKVYFSCNRDGTAPDDESDSFPDGCSKCFEACDYALGVPGVSEHSCADISGGGGSSPPDWWSFSPDIGPCQCSCREQDEDECNLTCVTCSGLTCNADFNVEANSCAYQISLTPSASCCNSQAYLNAVFIIDDAISMGTQVQNIVNNISSLVSDVAVTGAGLRLGIVQYGQDSNSGAPSVLLDFTEDVDSFINVLNSDFGATGSTSPAFSAVELGLQSFTWNGTENYLFLFGNNLAQCDSCEPITGSIGESNKQPSVEALVNLASLYNVKIITMQPQDGATFDSNKRELSTSTGGLDLNINENFASIIDTLDLFILPASCRCLDTDPVYIQICNGGQDIDGNCIDPDINIPIRRCVNEDNSDCTCSEPYVFEVCGETVIIQPDANSLSLKCCDEIEGGCDCPTTTVPPRGCCGLACDERDICPPNYATLQDAIDAVWCECWQKARSGEFILVDSDCTQCTIPSENDDSFINVKAIAECKIKVPDGSGGYFEVSRSQIEREVTERWSRCYGGTNAPLGQDDEPSKAPVSLNEVLCQPKCSIADELIQPSGCNFVKNPSVTILNNGIGLVAYEHFDDVSSVKIKQFHTSVPAKILPHRTTNYGRLSHSSKWSGNPKTAKLYFIDETIPTYLLNSSSSDLNDMVVFLNGPLQNQCFKLATTPYGTDAIGDYVQFVIGNDIVLSNNFPSGDDVYNIKWFIIDADDKGLIGDLTATTADFPGSSFLLNRNNIDSALQLPHHVYNGYKVPIAHPSITAAFNYMNSTENSHFVYLTYQAMEDKKWKIYLRQIRLSEYSKENIISSNSFSFVPLSSLNISDVSYKVVCVYDRCEPFESRFLATRHVVFQIFLSDGREVFNRDFLNLNDQWSDLCPGMLLSDFSKSKVFVKLSHSVICDRCPSNFNSIFYDWITGEEFVVPVIQISSNSLFNIVKRANDFSVDLGEFSNLTVDDVKVFKSFVQATWYDNVSISTWVTLSDSGLENLLKYKGLDVSEPILLAESVDGHCTNPKIKINRNNDIFVTYERIENTVSQVYLLGTVAPSSSLPVGVLQSKNIDRTVDYFLSPSDFRYNSLITLPTEGVNQLPDIYIDDNDVVHLTWQSNRDKQWEIYYANSTDAFRPVRITKYKSKSFSPSITGDSYGNVFISWHDDRFGNWEIFLAYKDDVRVQQLYEQDPYLASIRNVDIGYRHYSDLVTLNLLNDTEETICVSNLTVKLFSDRMLQNSVIDITQLQYPFAFRLPESINMRNTMSFTAMDIDSWTTYSNVTINGDLFYVYTSPIFNTDNFGSVIENIQLAFTESVTPFYFSYSASDTELTVQLGDNGFPVSDNWGNTLYYEYTSVTNNQVINVEDNFIPGSSYNLTGVKGKYKFIRLAFSSSSTIDQISNISIVSILRNRFCIAPGQTQEVLFDLMPSVRLDSEGVQTTEVPLFINLAQNNTYFVQTQATTDSNEIVTFPDQKISISCESCIRSTATWNYNTCSEAITITNDTDDDKYYNIRVRFYSDNKMRDLIFQYDTFSDGQLYCFTVDDGQSADAVWTDFGLEISKGQTKTVFLWPSLARVTGLICGIHYWVTHEICSSNIDTNTGCNRDELLSVTGSLHDWVCNCSSLRWNGVVEDAPLDIRQIVNWKSSAYGYSDTRITETSANNLHPIIRTRRDLTGIILYATDRNHINDEYINKFEIYGSVFSLFPSSKMYASGAQSIISNSDLLVKQDIPVSACSGQNCNDGSNDLISGYRLAFEFDQYDNIFLASEKFSTFDGCHSFVENSNQSIIVHRCGLQASNLVFDTTSGLVGESLHCPSPEILQKSAPLVTDPIFQKIIKLIRVKKKFVSYFVSRNNSEMPVVNNCSIVLEIISEPDVIAVRLKNNISSSWSSWFPIDLSIGDYAFEIPWNLSLGSGDKNIIIQAATYQGLSSTFSLSLIADYESIQHSVKFYKTNKTDAPVPRPLSEIDSLLEILNDNAFNDVFSDEFLLPTYDGFPVIGMRKPIIVDTAMFVQDSEYLFIEIITTTTYLDELGILQSNLSEEDKLKLCPVFDFIQQGHADLFGLPTKFDASSLSFKGVVPVYKSNSGNNIDGLSFVRIDFNKDCKSLSNNVQTGSNFSKDNYNTMASSFNYTVSPDEFANIERDDLGFIKYKLNFAINSKEDPYFVFGDPGYGA